MSQSSRIAMLNGLLDDSPLFRLLVCVRRTIDSLVLLQVVRAHLQTPVCQVCLRNNDCGRYVACDNHYAMMILILKSGFNYFIVVFTICTYVIEAVLNVNKVDP